MFSKFSKRLASYFNRFLDNISPLRNKSTGLLAETEKARRELKNARELFNHADKEMVDYAIHNLDAAERRYIALLKKSREEGIKAWSPEIIKDDKKTPS